MKLKTGEYICVVRKPNIINGCLIYTITMTGDKGRIIKKGLNNKLVKKWAFVDDGIEK